MFAKKYSLFLLGLILSLAVLWPLAKPGYFSHHDDVQVIRLYEMHQCFLDDQIPSRWVPDLGLGYGYPLFNYYGPLPYYLGDLLYRLTSDYLISAKLLFALSALLAYIGMYLLGSMLWGSFGGTLSAVLYSLAPYHAANLFVRGAMGELWGMACLPFVLYFLLRIWKGKRTKNILSFALSYALLIASHNISAMLFLPVILLFSLILFLQKRDSGFLLRLFIGFILAALLSAFYWLPAIFESKYVHLESMTVGYFSYTEHFKGLRKLLAFGWDWRPSLREYPGSEPDGNWYTVGWVHLLIFLGSVLGLIFSRKIRKGKYYYLVLISSLLIIIYVVFIHPRSLPIWQVFSPLLKYVQFPWRFLGLIVFFISLISGVWLKLAGIKREKVILLAIIIFALLFNWRYFRPEKYLGVNQNDYLQGEFWDKQIRRSIFDYTPIYAVLPPPGPAPDLPEVLDGQAEIIDYQKGSNWQKGELKVGENGATIRLPLFDFPGMEVRVNGQKVRHVNSDCRNESYCMGLITFKVTSGNQQIEARLTNTYARKIGNGLSLIGVMMIAVLVTKRKGEE